MAQNHSQTTETPSQLNQVIDANKLWSDDYSEHFQPDKSNLVKRYAVPHFNSSIGAESGGLA